MKLLLPVGGMFVGVISCCCCGGGDLESLLEELEAQNGASTPSIDDYAEAQEAAEAAGASAGTPSAGGGITAGLCGRFKSDGFSLPSGYSVISCSTTSGTESLLAMGGTTPSELCKSLKSQALSAGWSVESEADMDSTVALMLKSGGSRMSLACTDTAGQTAVAASITPG